MTQHTPGPWMVEPINGGETYQITSSESRHFAVIAETPVDGTGRDETNAHLIAAAPELLALVQHAVNAWPELEQGEGDLIDFMVEWIEDARAAIAKATGQHIPDTLAGISPASDQPTQDKADMWVDVRPVRDDGEGFETCPLSEATAVGVYINNPMAMHVRDFDIGGWTDTPASVATEALAWADALAEHLGCSVISQLREG